MTYIPKFTRRYTLTDDRCESRKSDDGFGVMSFKVGEDEFEIEVDIDLDAIVKYMGKKAVRSKSGRSRDGYVVVKRCRKLRSK